MYNIIPLALFLVSLATVIGIAVKKFPVLANLDIESIQAEREAKFKERIIGNRLKRNFFKYYTRLMKIAVPLAEAISHFFKWSYKKLVDFKENYNKAEVVISNTEETVNKLFLEAEEDLKKEDFSAAENKLIKIIELDCKNVNAFCELARAYFARKDFNEAKQTWEHALRLMEKKCERQAESGRNNEDNTEEKNAASNQLADIYCDLSWVCLKMEDTGGALENINKALKTTPNNPRYLDIKLEISIIKKDKILAEKVLDKIQQVNPENQKIGDLKEQISKL